MPEIIKTKLKSNKKNLPSYLVFAFSLLKGLFTVMLLLGLICIKLYNNSSFTPFYGILCYVAVAFGGFVSGYSLCKGLKGRGIVNGFIGGLIYGLIITLVFMGIMLFDVKLQLLSVPLIAIIFGSLGGIVCANK